MFARRISLQPKVGDFPTLSQSTSIRSVSLSLFWSVSLIQLLNAKLFFIIAVSDFIRTSLGPRGMDKMVSDVDLSSYFLLAIALSIFH
jgi:hypothetical protein